MSDKQLKKELRQQISKCIKFLSKVEKKKDKEYEGKAFDKSAVHSVKFMLGTLIQSLATLEQLDELYHCQYCKQRANKK